MDFAQRPRGESASHDLGEVSHVLHALTVGGGCFEVVVHLRNRQILSELSFHTLGVAKTVFLVYLILID